MRSSRVSVMLFVSLLAGASILALNSGVRMVQLVGVALIAIAILVFVGAVHDILRR